jgi:diguanylate cyclase
MSQEHIAKNILNRLNIAVLHRLSPGVYEVMGEPPAFYNRFFPLSEGRPCPTPWAHSYMLEFFYESAEDFFAAQSEGLLSSGTWEEEHLCAEDQALIAEAITFGSVQVIILHLLTDVYTERASIMRKAREQLLEKRMLVNDLEKYKSESRTDGLTQVLNRTAFMKVLPAYLSKAEEMGVHFSLIMLDIDHFKRVNDTYGHQAGDLVLVTLGELLRARLRRDDIVGRYGGEEFIVIISQATGEQVRRIAEKLRKSVAEHHFADMPSITISLGVTSYRPGDTAEEMIRRSDQAMYASKHAGRNTVREG